MLGDLMILKFLFHKFVSILFKQVKLQYVIIFILYVLMIILHICLKLYGPDILHSSIPDAIRILISLPQVFYYNIDYIDKIYNL